MAPKPRPTSITPAWLDQAREIADAGDRWLISIGRSVGRLGSWLGQPATASEDEPSTPRAGSSTRRNRSSGPDRRPSSSTRAKSGPCHFGLMSATPAASCESGAPDHLPASAESADHAAGVLPLVQALARVVADHEAGGYAGLANDERLWTLLDLLYVLAERPPPGPGGAHEPSCEEC